MPNLLTKQSILIDVFAEDGTYSVDFIGCKLDDAYMVLRSIIHSLEEGTILENAEGVSITDEHGNPIDPEQCRTAIGRAKATFEASGDPGKKTPIH